MKGGHLVNWAEVCLDNKSGGLEIKNIMIMNDALVLNQL